MTKLSEIVNEITNPAPSDLLYGVDSVPASGRVTLQTLFGSESSVRYVSKDGSNAYDGTNSRFPKLTIQAAIDSATSPAVVFVTDPGQYTEDLIIPDGVGVIGPAMTLIGNHEIGEDCYLEALFLYKGSAGNLVDKKGSTAHAYVRCHVADTRGIGGTVTGGAGFRNSSNGGILHVKGDVMYIAASTFGMTDGGGSGFGHQHGEWNDLYFAGNGAIGLRTGSAASKMLLRFDHMIKFGTPVSTTGIAAVASGSQVWVNGNQIDLDEAWDNSSGAEMYVICPDVKGTRSGPVSGMSLIGNGEHQAIGAETITGFIEVQDADGVTRKLAVVS